MKIKIFGWRNPDLSITDRLERGFLSSGNEITDSDDADLVIAMDPNYYEKAEEYYRINKKAIKLFNVLDVPEHLFPSYPVEKIKENLKNADIITSISKFTQRQAQKHYGVKSEVIYTPCLEMDRTRAVKSIPFLYVGRAADPNKRFSLARACVQGLGLPEKFLVVVGPEFANFGVYAGPVPSKKLSGIYAQSKYVLLPSRSEGVGLTMIEGALAGCIPILCDDNEAALEFGFSDFCAAPNPESLIDLIDRIELNYKEYRMKIDEIVESQGLESKFNNIQVAKIITELYESKLACQ